MTSWNPPRESHFAPPARQELRGLAFNSISSDVAVNMHSVFMLLPFGGDSICIAGEGFQDTTGSSHVTHASPTPLKIYDPTQTLLPT